MPRGKTETPVSQKRTDKNPESEKSARKGKKKTKRGNVSRASLKRLMLEGASTRGSVKRVSLKAINAAKNHVNVFLKTVSQHLNRYSNIAQKKTLDERAIRNIVSNDLKKLAVSDAQIVGARSIERGLSRAGVARQLTKSQLNVTRMSSRFRDALLNLTETYVRKLGAQGAEFAMCSKRKTLLQVDIDAAARSITD